MDRGIEEAGASIPVGTNSVWKPLATNRTISIIVV